MKHIHYLDEKAEEISEAGAKGIKMRTVIGEKDGAPNFYMRIVSFEPGGQSPNHSHPWEHENYIIKGRGILEVDGKTVNVQPGNVIYIPPNANHYYQAIDAMELICLIPKL
jgi:quercetin dioxygenase-like cupin family protein